MSTQPYAPMCPDCTWTELWSNLEAARAAAVWHTYEAHPAIWKGIIGDRLPLDAKPETLGVRL